MSSLGTVHLVFEIESLPGAWCLLIRLDRVDREVLSLYPQHWDFKHTSICLAFNVSIGVLIVCSKNFTDLMPKISF